MYSFAIPVMLQFYCFSDQQGRLSTQTKKIYSSVDMRGKDNDRQMTSYYSS